MWRLLIAGMAALFSLSLQAQQVNLYQLESGQGPYLQTYLDHQIYRYAHYGNLSDLVVVDAEGTQLPFTMDKASNPAPKQVAQNLPFFTLTKGENAETIKSLLLEQVQISNEQVALQLKQPGPPAQSGGDVDFYLVNISQIAQGIDALQLQWSSPEANRLLGVEVDGSGDLQHWQTLTQATLANLSKDGEQLKADKVSLNLAPHAFRFLRIKFTQAAPDTRLTQVAHLQWASPPEGNHSESWTLDGKLAEDQQSSLRATAELRGESVAAWEYLRKDVAEVESLALDLGDLSYGDRLRFFSRSTTTKPWRLVYQGIWFNTQVGANWQHSQALRLYSNRDPHWRLELAQSVRGRVAPKLIFSRTLDRLRFIANSHPPFYLALEQNARQSTHASAAQVFAQLVEGELAEWQTVGLNRLVSEDYQRQRLDTPFTWRSWLFWTALVTAVILLLWLVIRLLGQIAVAKSTPQR